MASNPRRMVWACVECGVEGTPGVELSYRGLCKACSITRATEAAEQMAAKRGPYWDRYVEREIARARTLADSC